MTKSIQTALAPLLIIGSFCSLGLFEYPLGQPRLYFTYLYFLITWSLFTYFFYYLVYNSYTPHLYISWPNVIIMITAIVSMLISMFRFKELKMCLRKLSIVDDTLEALGTVKEYQWLRNWIIGIITGWIILSFFMNAFDSFWLNYEYFSISRICVPFLGNHLLHVNTLSALIWGTVLGHVHLQLCLISRELNKVFNIQMSLQMTSYFAFLVELCREIYTIYIDKNEITDSIFVYVWGIIYSIIILTLNHICQTVYYNADVAIAILYKLSNNNLDEDLREQVLQFILQIKQREIKFGMGLSTLVMISFGGYVLLSVQINSMPFFMKFESKLPNFFREDICQLTERWCKVIENNGDYFEY